MDGTKIPTAKHNQKELVYMLMRSQRLTLTDVVKRINDKFPEYKTSVQNLNQKLVRGSLRDYELSQIAEVCGYELALVEFGDVKQDVPIITVDSPDGVLVFSGDNAEKAVEFYTAECAKHGWGDKTYQAALIHTLKKKLNVNIIPYSFDI